MPLVRVDLLAGTTPRYRAAVSAAISRALSETLGVAADDVFHVVTEHTDGLVFSRSYGGFERSDDFLLIQITFRAGRHASAKRALYRAIVDHLERDLAVRPDDVFIGIVDVAPENWSFGRGEMAGDPSPADR